MYFQYSENHQNNNNYEHQQRNHTVHHDDIQKNISKLNSYIQFCISCDGEEIGDNITSLESWIEKINIPFVPKISTRPPYEIVILDPLNEIWNDNEWE